MIYKQFDRDGHTDIISEDLKTTFHIYHIYGSTTWRIDLSKVDSFGRTSQAFEKTFVGFKTPESAMDFVSELVRPDTIRMMKVRQE